MKKYRIRQSTRSIVREACVKGARYYKKYFIEKKYVIVTEDYAFHTVYFKKSDFIHLTGLDTRFRPNVFFKVCLEDTLEESDIHLFQTHTDSTLRQKANILKKLHAFLHADASTNLFLDELITETYIFECAIRNDARNSCIAFKKSSDNAHASARSIRKASSSANTSNALRINAIFCGETDSEKLDTLVYIRNASNIICNVPSLTNLVEQNLLKKLKNKMK